MRTYRDERGLEKLKRQAQREGGHILILPSEVTEEAGGLSSLTLDLPSEGKDNVNLSSVQENGEKIKMFRRILKKYIVYLQKSF